MPDKRKIGTFYENRIIDYLALSGHKIICHSYSPTSFAEVDIISYDNGTLVFTEVKAIQNTFWQEENIAKKINSLKIKKIKRLAMYFIVNSSVPYSNIRFDVVAVCKNKITHYKGV